MRLVVAVQLRPGRGADNLWCKGSSVLAAVGVLVFLCTAVGIGSAAQWRNHTNVNTARDLFPAGDSLWAATSGGLVLFVEETTKTLTNAEGPADNDLNFVLVDSSGNLWTGGSGGRLSTWNSSSGRWSHFDFFDQTQQPLRLSAAAADGDFLWVASHLGVHKFDTQHDGGEIKESFRRFGELPTDEPVNDVLITAGDIWVATGAGCAVARTADVNLQDYSRWRSFSRNNSALQSDEVLALAAFAGMVFAATDNGLYYFAGATGDSTWHRLPGPAVEYRDLFPLPEVLYGATSAGITSCKLSGCELLPTDGMTRKSSRAVCQTAAGDLWVAADGGSGFSIYDGEQWITATVSGITSNEIHDLVIDHRGQVWVAHPFAPVSLWNGVGWQIIDSLHGGPTTNSLAVDHQDRIWFGTHGGGAIRFDPTLGDDGYLHYNEANSTLRGTEPPPRNTYIVVYDIVVDDSGRVWFANFADWDDRVLAFYDPAQDCWGYFGTPHGFPTVEPISLFPLTNELLIGFDGGGLADFELQDQRSLCVGGTQAPQTPLIGFFDEADNLPSGQVRCLYVDLTRKVWVGTSGGLAYYDSDWRRFRTQTLGDVASPMINALLADGGNNLWVGTDEGLFLLQAQGEVIHFTPQNSGLAQQFVTALAINHDTLWVGTLGGISTCAGCASLATSVDEILAYPNPFIVSHEDEVIKFDAVPGTKITIYNAAGETIADLGLTGEWDGRNEAGRLVASGVYLFVAADPAGNYGRGKFAVIRK